MQRVFKSLKDQQESVSSDSKDDFEHNEILSKNRYNNDFIKEQIRKNINNYFAEDKKKNAEEFIEKLE